MRYKYSKSEEKSILASIVVLIDTREQENKHIIAWFDAKGIPWKSMALDFGDYSFYIPKNEELDIPRDLMFTDEIVIERKASLEEVSGNLAGADRGHRFEAELVRARKSQAIFDLVIENSPEHPSSWLDIMSGNYGTEYAPKSYLARLHAFIARYGISVNFVDAIMMGMHIYYRFNYYARERFGAVLMDDLEAKQEYHEPKQASFFEKSDSYTETMRHPDAQ